jgi:ribose transport system permease protein
MTMAKELVSQDPMPAAAVERRPNASGVYLSFGLPLALVLIVIVFSFLAPSFGSAENMESIIRSASISALMFLGLTWVFAVGEIDISFVAVAALSNMVIAGLVAAGYSWGLACVAGFGAGFAVGVVNGLLVAYAKLPSLVMTIASGGIASALAAAIGLGSSVPIDTPEILHSVVTASIGPIPVLAIFCAVVFLVAWHVQERLTLGHYIYATAENRQAVVEAGIPVERIVMLLFVLAAACGSFGGLLLTVELSSGQPSIASSFFLDGLTAVLLGGTMLKLGKPNVLGTLVSVLILTSLVRGGALLGWPDSTFQMIKGGLLLIGIALITWSTYEKEGKPDAR